MPLKASEAKSVIRRLLDEGRFVSPGKGTHAREEMDKDGLTDVDAVNVLRRGVMREPEWENGSWRYRAETLKMAFVVVIEPEPTEMPRPEQDLGETELIVVTGWKTKQR